MIGQSHEKNTVKLKAHLAAFIVLSGFLFGPVQSLKAENLTAVFSVFPPLIYPNALNRSDGPGVLVEIYQKVLPTLGYDIDLRQLPSKRIVTLMEKGQTVDIYTYADYSIGKRPIMLMAHRSSI